MRCENWNVHGVGAHLLGSTRSHMVVKRQRMLGQAVGCFAQGARIALTSLPFIKAGDCQSFSESSDPMMPTAWRGWGSLVNKERLRHTNLANPLSHKHHCFDRRVMACAHPIKQPERLPR